MSQDLERRLAEYNYGKSKFTSGHIPWELIYFESFPTSGEARIREKYFKSAAGKNMLKRN